MTDPNTNTTISSWGWTRPPCHCWISMSSGHGYPCNEYGASRQTSSGPVPCTYTGHCYCQDGPTVGEVLHRHCCKCGSVLAEPFALAYHGIGKHVSVDDVHAGLLRRQQRRRPPPLETT